MSLYTPFSYRTRNVIFLSQAGTDTAGHCTHIYTHIHTHTPHKQKSEHVKGKKFVTVLIKTLEVNRQSEFRGMLF